MRKDFEKLFSVLTPPEPSPELFGCVMKAIYDQQILARARRKFLVFSSLAAASIAGAVLAFIALWQSFAQSGAIQFISLIFSDTGAVLALFQDYMLSVWETLPVLDLAVFFAVMFVFLYSLKYLFTTAEIVFKPSHPFHF